MKKAVFILIAENDLSDFAGLISKVKGLGTSKNLYKASDSLHFLETLKAVEEAADSVFTTEVRVIIDLSLPYFEAFVCLQALAACDYKCPVLVYLLDDEHMIKPCPRIEQYTIAGRFDKPLGEEEITRIVYYDHTNYFQKEPGNLSGATNQNPF